MKKELYIIPGLGETCRRKPYQLLATLAHKKGYDILFKNVDWKEKLSTQVFPVSKNAVIFGFSLGAVLAQMVAQRYNCRCIILASATPHQSFKKEKDKQALIDLLGRKFVEDVIKNLRLKNLAHKSIALYGELELDGEVADFVIPKTGHELNDLYIKKIAGLI